MNDRRCDPGYRPMSDDKQDVDAILQQRAIAIMDAVVGVPASAQAIRRIEDTIFDATGWRARAGMQADGTLVVQVQATPTFWLSRRMAGAGAPAGEGASLPAEAYALLMGFMGRTPSPDLMREIETEMQTHLGVSASAAFAGNQIQVGIHAETPFWLQLVPDLAAEESPDGRA